MAPGARQVKRRPVGYHAPMSYPPKPKDLPEPPSRTRFVVLGALCLLSGVLYLDRICISAALDSIKSDLNLSNTDLSYVLMAFTLAYGLFEVPTGRWGDQLG